MVLERLLEPSLKLKPGKCHFVRKSVEYLGYLITPEGLASNPRQVSAVVNFPIQASVTNVRQFLWLTSYYRCFVGQFAKITAPLHNLTRKNVEFVWTEDCQVAFEDLKAKLTETPIALMKILYWRRMLVICGLGAVLSQYQPDGHLCPVAYTNLMLREL